MEAKTVKNLLKNVVEKHVFFGPRFFWYFCGFLRFWVDFGLIWGSLGPPKIGQKCKKTIKKRFLEAHWRQKCFLDRFFTLFHGFWLIFEWFWAPEPLGQIVPKATFGTNRSNNDLWDKSLSEQPIWSYTLHAMQHTL